MSKKLILEHYGYLICGHVEVTTWDGGSGETDMTCQIIKSTKKPSRDKISPLINDGGYGVQSIDYAFVNLYELYRNKRADISGVKKNIDTLEFNEDELKKCKRGI